jgi:nucleoside-diphosphate-sugar epimerase
MRKNANALTYRRVLVTGSAGLVGAGLIDHILAAYPGVAIRGTYHDSPPVTADKRVEYVRADLRKRPDVRRVMQGCDCGVLAAARTGGAATAQRNPYAQVTDNLLIDSLSLEEASREGLRRVIYLSSAVVYQEKGGRLRECDLDLNLDPHPSYFGVGWVKRCAEKLCSFWNAKYGLETVVVRAANVYGPYAVFDPSYSNFIPALVRKAADCMDPFEVWGKADVMRDVLYVEDFARSIMMLLTQPGISYGVFNVGSGTGVTVGQVVKEVLRQTRHKPCTIKYLTRKPSTINCRVLDCSLIKRVVGWFPRISLAEGLRKTVEWWKSNKGGWVR